MCGRYSFDSLVISEELWQEIEALGEKRGEPVKTGEIRPGDAAPAIALSRAGRRAPFLMRWGFRLSSGRLVINARSETAADSPMFSDGMRRRRCLLPAGKYYEWEKTGGGRVKYELAPAGAPFCLAGLYRFEENRPVFVVLTRESAPGIAFLHDRMPVMLPHALHADWLDPSVDARRTLRGALTDVAFRPALEA